NLTDKQQQSVIFNRLLKPTLQETEPQYNIVTKQMSELDQNDKRKDAYKDVASQYNRIVDGLLSMFEEMSRAKQNDQFRKGRDSTKTYRRQGADGREL